MAEKEQFEILEQILRQFHSAGILKEIMLIKSILRTVPRKWLQAILSVSGKHFPQLNETARDL